MRAFGPAQARREHSAGEGGAGAAVCPHADTLIPAPIRKDFHLSVRSLRDRETKDVQSAAWILLGSVFAVLLIACANVASLNDGARRGTRAGVGGALGPGREPRKADQANTYRGVDAIAGGAVAGIVLAEGLLMVFLRLAPTGIPFLTRAGLDVRIALFTVMLSLVLRSAVWTVACFAKRRGLWRWRRARRNHAIAHHATAKPGGEPDCDQHGSAVRAALLVRSFQNLEGQSLGLQTQGVLSRGLRCLASVMTRARRRWNSIFDWKRRSSVFRGFMR